MKRNANFFLQFFSIQLLEKKKQYFLLLFAKGVKRLIYNH